MIKKEQINFFRSSFMESHELAPGDIFIGIDHDHNPAFFEVKYAHPDGRVKIDNDRFIRGHLFQVVGRRKK